MADNVNTLKLFGFEIKRAKKDDKDKEKLQSVVPPTDTDGAGYVTATAGHFGQYINMDGDDDCP